MNRPNNQSTKQSFNQSINQPDVCLADEIHKILEILTKKVKIIKKIHKTEGIGVDNDIGFLLLNLTFE
jgi:hypothetical protein